MLSGIISKSYIFLSFLISFVYFQLDTLFEISIRAREYNGSEVVSLSPGSLMVRAHLRLKRPDVDAARKLGTAFLRGLTNDHHHSWLGPFTVDVDSIRFSEVLVESPSVSAPTVTSEPSPKHHLYHDRHQSTPRPQGNMPDVGWGQWGPWSACSPCSPQYDQIRSRQCRLDNGQGLLISNIELCSQQANAGSVGSSGEIQTRSCQCEIPERKEEPTTTTTTTTTPATTTIASILPPYREHENSDQDTFSNEASDNGKKWHESFCSIFILLKPLFQVLVPVDFFIFAYLFY